MNWADLGRAPEAWIREELRAECLSKGRKKRPKHTRARTREKLVFAGSTTPRRDPQETTWYQGTANQEKPNALVLFPRW